MKHIVFVIICLVGIVVQPGRLAQNAEQQRAVQARWASLDREVPARVERTSFNRQDYLVAYSYAPPEAQGTGGRISATAPVDYATYAAARLGSPISVRYSSADPSVSDIKGSRYDQTLRLINLGSQLGLLFCIVGLLLDGIYLLAAWKGMLKLPERPKLRGGIYAAIGLAALVQALAIVGAGETRDFAGLLMIGVLCLTQGGILLQKGAGAERSCAGEAIGGLWLVGLFLVDGFAPLSPAHAATLPALLVYASVLLLAELLLRKAEAPKIV